MMDILPIIIGVGILSAAIIIACWWVEKEYHPLLPPHPGIVIFTPTNTYPYLQRRAAWISRLEAEMRDRFKGGEKT